MIENVNIKRLMQCCNLALGIVTLKVKAKHESTITACNMARDNSLGC
jgi:hypothetical protein